MTTGQPMPDNVVLRYGSAKVFERADTLSPELTLLGPDDTFTVLGTESEYYQVRLADGRVGFVWSHNVDGTDMPLTTNEQTRADERAARAAQPPGGWRGAMNRIRGQ